MIELLLAISLSVEPAMAHEDYEPVIERKRTHKKRRKTKRPVKGLK
tara:strand:+ start:37 stop:174 length:138 start_codon:yes stop_codon:yes gene_type:complete